jgi:hypothetical protein
MTKGGTMNTPPSKGGDAPTIGVGGPTSGEAGATPTHETMAETGGSGGAPLTKPRKEETAESRQSTQVGEPQGERQGERQGGDAGRNTPDAEGAGTAATATGSGKQDTRSQQAGINQTGLGVPETGGNQSEQDLAPPYRK